jgi:hypothetical protein
VLPTASPKNRFVIFANKELVVEALVVEEFNVWIKALVPKRFEIYEERDVRLVRFAFCEERFVVVALVKVAFVL